MPPHPALSPPSGNGGANSPGPQRRRAADAALARALMSAPRILLIDEPSVGLVPVLVKRAIEKIKELKDRHQLAVLMADQNFNQSCSVSRPGPPDSIHPFIPLRKMRRGSGERGDEWQLRELPRSRIACPALKRDRVARLGSRSSGVGGTAGGISGRAVPDAAEWSDARRQRITVSLDRIVQQSEERAPRRPLGRSASVGERLAAISQVAAPARW